MSGRLSFETAIGTCVLAWSERGVTSFRLPDATAAAGDSASDEPLAADAPDWVKEAVAAVRRLLRGEKVDLAFVPVDLDQVPPFHRKVYDVARGIPPGRGMTYGAVAQAVGEPGAARAVGQALGKNPIPVVIPCHRVLAANGKAGGFSAPGGARSKLRLLAIEGYAGDEPSLFDR